MADSPTIASSPKPQIADLIATAIRVTMLILGTLGVYQGAVSDTAITLIAGGLADLVAAAWALYDQWRQAQHVHAAAVASARSASARRYPAYATVTKTMKGMVK